MDCVSQMTKRKDLLGIARICVLCPLSFSGSAQCQELAALGRSWWCNVHRLCRSGLPLGDVAWVWCLPSTQLPRAATRAHLATVGSTSSAELDNCLQRAVAKTELCHLYWLLNSYLLKINSEQPPFSNQLLKLILTALESVSVTSKFFKIIRSQSVTILPARVCLRYPYSFVLARWKHPWQRCSGAVLWQLLCECYPWPTRTLVADSIDLMKEKAESFSPQLLQGLWSKLKTKNPKIVVMSPNHMLTIPSVFGPWQKIKSSAENIFFGTRIWKDLVAEKGTIPSETVPIARGPSRVARSPDGSVIILAISQTTWFQTSLAQASASNGMAKPDSSWRFFF